jgi:hypothetical protein
LTKKGEKKRVDTRKKYDVKLRPVRGEPSDINWENLNLSKNQQFMRERITLVANIAEALVHIQRTETRHDKDRMHDEHGPKLIHRQGVDRERAGG